jgi:hypothetical protein
VALIMTTRPTILFFAGNHLSENVLTAPLPNNDKWDRLYRVFADQRQEGLRDDTQE